MDTRTRGLLSGLLMLVLTSCGIEGRIENSQPKQEEAVISKLVYTKSYSAPSISFGFDGKMHFKIKDFPEDYLIQLDCKDHNQHLLSGSDRLPKEIYNANFKQGERVLVDFTEKEFARYKTKNGKQEELERQILETIINNISHIPIAEITTDKQIQELK